MVSQRMPGHMPPAKRSLLRFVQRRGVVMSLEQFDQKRLAVVVPVPGASTVLRGTALYVNDPAVGNCLRIPIVDEASTGLEILLKEEDWAGKIVKDEKYGCDFVVVLDQQQWCAN